MKIDETLLNEVDKLYRPTLKNLEVKNPKLLVLFSAPPSTGKSTLAKQLENHFKMLRFENDVIRKIVGKLYPMSDLKEKSEVSYAYMERLQAQLAKDTLNGLWIVDATIDVYYQKLFDFAQKNGFECFVIALKIPESTHRQRILEGGDRPHATAQEYLGHMPIRRKEQQKFLGSYTPDLVLGAHYKIEEIFCAIQHRLNVLNRLSKSL